MANRKVAVYKQVKVDGVWVKCPPYVNSKNNKPENDKVLVKGKLAIHPEGDWGIFYYEGTKRKWKSIGPKYAEAKRAADIKELALRGRAEGLVIEEKTDKTPLQAAIDLFLEDIKGSRRPKTYQLLRYDLKEFCGWVKKPYIEDITRKDLLDFKQWVLTTPEKPRASAPHRSGKLRSVRTAANKVAEVNQFHRWFMKIDPGKGLVTMKDVKYDEDDAEVFTEEELKAFFGACKPNHHLLFSTFLQTGLRKQEMMNLVWDAIDFTQRVIRVKANKETGHRTKTGKVRSVPVPEDLLKRLAEYKLTSTHTLVFPTRTGLPNDKMWDLCKSIAKRAGLEPERFFIHKFRATYATTCLRRGLDVKTVQVLLGHSGKDFSSTSRYLAAAEGKELQAKVEGVWAKPEPVAVPVNRDLEDDLRELEV